MIVLQKYIFTVVESNILIEWFKQKIRENLKIFHETGKCVNEKSEGCYESSQINHADWKRYYVVLSWKISVVDLKQHRNCVLIEGRFQKG